jgi:hypothetical protein
MMLVHASCTWGGEECVCSAECSAAFLWQRGAIGAHAP